MSGSNKPRWPRRGSCGRGLRFISRIAAKTEEEREHLVICHVVTLRSVRNERPETGYAQMHLFCSFASSSAPVGHDSCVVGDEHSSRWRRRVHPQQTEYRAMKDCPRRLSLIRAMSDDEVFPRVASRQPVGWVYSS
jgi:hypothetical protein